MSLCRYCYFRGVVVLLLRFRQYGWVGEEQVAFHPIGHFLSPVVVQEYPVCIQATRECLQEFEKLWMQFRNIQVRLDDLSRQKSSKEFPHSLWKTPLFVVQRNFHFLLAQYFSGSLFPRKYALTEQHVEQQKAQPTNHQ